jgi:hypothetical protein
MTHILVLAFTPHPMTPFPVLRGNQYAHITETRRTVTLYDRAAATMEAPGWTHELYLHDSSSFENFSGDIERTAFLHDKTEYTQHAGWLMTLHAYGSNTVTVHGGTVLKVILHGSSTWTAYGGFTESSTLQDSSSLVNLGGNVGDVFLYDEATATIYTGWVADLVADDESQATVYGGHLGSAQTLRGGRMLLFGGQFSRFTAYNKGMIVSCKSFRLHDGLTLHGSQIEGQGYITVFWRDGTSTHTLVESDHPSGAITVFASEESEAEEE